MAEETKKKDRGLWFREMKSELKKVVWPNRQTVLKNTGTVLLCSVAIGACIWIFDFVAVSAVDLILHVFGA
ncbi:MAG: preprotein translocase subunit SecE [Oscillospiraceae bacterium]|nr:preprotein translocase subunit SecE [Oscillospiraceae bacterium]